MDVFALSRNWFNFSFENPEKISPNHTALYFFAIEHCNRLGWKEKFGLPTTMAKEAIGIRSYNTYINTLNDLVEWGFIKMIEKSKNQHSSNIVALSKFDKALDKALDKAIVKHATKQRESKRSIDIPETKEQETKKQTLYQLAVDFWLKEFHIGWTFESVHGKALKSLLKKISGLQPDKTDEDHISLFKAFCIKLPDWFKDKDLQVLDSKFNEIVQQIKDAKNGQSKHTTAKEHLYDNSPFRT
jgi:hypothetical protein